MCASVVVVGGRAAVSVFPLVSAVAVVASRCQVFGLSSRRSSIMFGTFIKEDDDADSGVAGWSPGLGVKAFGVP